MGYVYIIQENEYIGTRRCKIGCTSKDNPYDRLRRYDKGYDVIFISKCINPYEVEKIIIEQFTDKFNLVLGKKEHFEGDMQEMTRTFHDIITNNLLERDNTKVFVRYDNNQLDNRINRLFLRAYISLSFQDNFMHYPGRERGDRIFRNIPINFPRDRNDENVRYFSYYKRELDKNEVHTPDDTGDCTDYLYSKDAIQLMKNMPTCCKFIEL